jgi:DNA-binding response OmpR family regulator
VSKILVVDDDEMMLDFLAEALRLDGHTVGTAPSGNPALDILETDLPLDLMVTDVVLPGLTGFSLARMARLRRPGMKILYISGHGDAELDRDRGVRLGELIHKPIRPDEFRRIVADTLSAVLAPRSAVLGAAAALA